MTHTIKTYKVILFFLAILSFINLNITLAAIDWTAILDGGRNIVNVIWPFILKIPAFASAIFNWLVNSVKFKWNWIVMPLYNFFNSYILPILKFITNPFFAALTFARSIVEYLMSKSSDFITNFTDSWIYKGSAKLRRWIVNFAKGAYKFFSSTLLKSLRAAFDATAEFISSCLSPIWIAFKNALIQLYDIEIIQKIVDTIYASLLAKIGLFVVLCLIAYAIYAGFSKSVESDELITGAKILPKSRSYKRFALSKSFKVILGVSIILISAYVAYTLFKLAYTHAQTVLKDEQIVLKMQQQPDDTVYGASLTGFKYNCIFTLNNWLNIKYTMYLDLVLLIFLVFSFYFLKQIKKGIRIIDIYAVFLFLIHSSFLIIKLIS